MVISLKNKILFGFIINILVVVAVGFVSYQRSQNRSALANLEANHEDILLSAIRTKTILIVNENLSKSYVITGDEGYLDKLDESRQMALEELVKFNFMLAKNPEQKKRFSEIQNFLGKRIQVIDQFIALRKQNKAYLASDYLRENSSNKALRQVDKLLAQIEDAENVSYNKEKVGKEELETLLSIIFDVLLVGIILLLITVYFIIAFQLRKRKAAELIIEGNDQLIRSIMDNSITPIFIKKVNGEYLLINKQFEKTFNRKKEEIIGKADHDIYPKEIADTLREGDIDVISGEKEKTFEEKFTHENETRNYMVVKFPLRGKDNKIYAIGGIATDITEKAKLDILVKESEEQIQTILDSAPDAIIIINDEGRIIRWNPKAEGLFGWTSGEVLGKLMHEIIMPLKYRKQHLDGMKLFFEKGDGSMLNKTMEVSAINRKNIEFEIELSISPAKFKDKYIFISFIRNITERILLQKKMEESEKFLNTIIENIPDIVFVKDTVELRYLRLNAAAEKWMGAPRQELLAKNNYDLFPKEEADFFTKSDMEILNSGRLMNIPEEEATTKFGKRILHTKKIPIKDQSGKPIYLLGISEDITEKKRLELEKIEADKLLELNAQRTTLILENIGEGVIVVDKNEKVVLSNHNAEEVIGVKENEMLSNTFDLVKKYRLYYADGKTVFPAQDLPLSKALRGEHTEDVEIIIEDIASNEKKQVILYGAPIRDENNEIVAGVTTIKDVTNLKQLAEEYNLSDVKYRKLIGFKLEEDTTAPLSNQK